MPRAAEAVLQDRSSIAVHLLSLAMRHQARRRFHAVRLSREDMPAVPADQSILVVSNHPSWWDPVMFVLLHTALFPGREGYGPMEAAALDRYRGLNRIGIFGIHPGHRGARRFLQVGNAVLRRRGTVLWVTAQGAFSDVRRPPELRPGVAHLMRGRESVVVLPLALEYPFWNESAPEALARYGPALLSAPTRSVAEWHTDLTRALSRTMAALAEDAQARDPTRFELLLGGRVGVGGVYDLWRRANAWWRGRPARLEHDA